MYCLSLLVSWQQQQTRGEDLFGVRPKQWNVRERKTVIRQFRYFTEGSGIWRHLLVAGLTSVVVYHVRAYRASSVPCNLNINSLLPLIASTAVSCRPLENRKITVQKQVKCHMFVSDEVDSECTRTQRGGVSAYYKILLSMIIPRTITCTHQYVRY